VSAWQAAGASEAARTHDLGAQATPSSRAPRTYSFSPTPAWASWGACASRTTTRVRTGETAVTSRTTGAEGSDWRKKCIWKPFYAAVMTARRQLVDMHVPTAYRGCRHGAVLGEIRGAAEGETDGPDPSRSWYAGDSPNWLCDRIEVTHTGSGFTSVFLCREWIGLGIGMEDRVADKASPHKEASA
jgi:hypothetical protein